MPNNDDDEKDPDYGYCNSCGEEMYRSDECCEDGEWVPYYDDDEDE